MVGFSLSHFWMGFFEFRRSSCFLRLSASSTNTASKPTNSPMARKAFVQYISSIQSNCAFAASHRRDEEGTFQHETAAK